VHFSAHGASHQPEGWKMPFFKPFAEDYTSAEEIVAVAPRHLIGKCVKKLSCATAF